MRLEPRADTGGIPDLVVERRLLASGATTVCGVDEVGRGCVFGPCAVGVVLLDGSSGEPPAGVRDSKLLTAAARRDLVPSIREWAAGSAVGMASAAEIDELGVTAALRLAAHRALGQLGRTASVVLLDGSYDWVTAPTQLDLFAEPDPVFVECGPVHTLVKADMSCASVAAASVLAKVARDDLVDELDAAYPGYGLAEHRGYGTPGHLDAIARLGATDHHRRSFSLPV